MDDSRILMFVRHETEVNLYGDPNQCVPAENTSVNVHNITSPIINQLMVLNSQCEAQNMKKQIIECYQNSLKEKKL